MSVAHPPGPAHPGAESSHGQGSPRAGSQPQVKAHLRALPLRVGTRGSPLALWQTRHFLGLITRFCPVLHDAKAFECRAGLDVFDDDDADGVLFVVDDELGCHRSPSFIRRRAWARRFPRFSRAAKN